jgi:hypothetical protein
MSLFRMQAIAQQKRCSSPPDKVAISLSKI